MGNYLSFSTLHFENGEIPLPDGEYRGSTTLHGENILSMEIVHQFKNYEVIFNRLKSCSSKTVYSNFKIIQGTIVAYGGIMGQEWNYRVPCFDSESGKIKFSQLNQKGEIYFQFPINKSP